MLRRPFRRAGVERIVVVRLSSRFDNSVWLEFGVDLNDWAMDKCKMSNVSDQ